MSCFGAPGGQVPSGFFGVSCVGPTPYAAPGISKYQCGKTCCNPGNAVARGRACNFYEVPIPEAQSGDLKEVGDITRDGWTDIGFVYSTDAYPVVNYLTKSCSRCDAQPYRSSGECTGCQAKPIDGNLVGGGVDGNYDTNTPAMYRPGAVPWPVQRKETAYERKTMCTNSGIGYGFTGRRCCPGLDRFNSNGMRHGQLHASGCKSNDCSQDLFYHPAVSIAQAPVRRFRLYARPNECGSSRWQYAVAEEGVKNSLFLTLPADPRQPPWSSCSTVDFNRQAWVQLTTGNFIYIPGNPGVFQVQLWVDVDVYRPNQSVFRGYSPVRRLPGRVWRKAPNSGLRNFVSHPSANGLLRPF